MTDKERKSCINTINLLRRLAYNIHGVMDVIDAENCDKIIYLLEQEQKTEWIPVKFRPLTEEEQEECPDYCCMADCLMPDEGDEILVTTTHGTVEKDEAGFDAGFYLDSGYDWQTDVIAWMPLPEPYKGGEGDQ